MLIKKHDTVDIVSMLELCRVVANIKAIFILSKFPVSFLCVPMAG